VFWAFLPDDVRRTGLHMNTNAAQNFVVRHWPGRTLAFLTIAVGWAVAQGYRLAFHPPGHWFGLLDALGVLLVAMLGYVSLMIAIQSVCGVPVLQTSDDGILVYNPWGTMAVRWSDIAGFSPGNFRWLRILLKDGAQPVGSRWARLLSMSVWVRNTLAVQMYTTVSRPDDVARALAEMQARTRGGGAGRDNA
jgi:Bacterial PH domain